MNISIILRHSVAPISFSIVWNRHHHHR